MTIPHMSLSGVGCLIINTFNMIISLDVQEDSRGRMQRREEWGVAWPCERVVWILHLNLDNLDVCRDNGNDNDNEELVRSLHS